MSLTFGTAPDSWGVWFPDNPAQPHWSQFLDEAASTGHRIIELGPFGYLPTDVNLLRDELAKRDLSLIAATLMTPDLYSADLFDKKIAEVRQIASLAAPLGAKYFVMMGDLYRGLDGSWNSPTAVDGAQWSQLVKTCDAVGKLVLEEFGMILAFHPHADTVVEYSEQVDRLLDQTDSRFTQLCLDTGHYFYRGGDSAALLRERHSRIPYMHLKSIDSSVLKIAQEEELAFTQAVGRGVIAEPAKGGIDFSGIASVMRDVEWKGYAIVEHDMYPVASMSAPALVSERSRQYFNSFGWKN